MLRCGLGPKSTKAITVATVRARHVQNQRILFARVGWMRFYNGPIPGDDRPIGGGSYNKTNIGFEVFNFRETNDKLYGYFQPQMRSHKVALERIDRSIGVADTLDNVLVIFVARRPVGGQVVVGWYRDATVYRDEEKQSPGKPHGYGHFCWAQRSACVLLPEGNRSVLIPGGRGGMGTTNICYPLSTDGSAKNAPWMEHAAKFVDGYQAANLLEHPEESAEAESVAAIENAIAQSRGQGFARTPQERKAVEDHAMRAAKKYFRSQGFLVEDVSSRCPYDLVCTRQSSQVHVEVKGSTTDGSSIVLTHNEVKHASDPHTTCALFLLHSITLDRGKASGGTQIVLNPWQLQQVNLKPVTYIYQLA